MTTQTQGRVAVVLGGTRGIGFACASALAGAAHRVVVASRAEAHVKAATEALQAAGATALGVVANASEPDELARVFDQAEQNFGAIDVLVNNGGGPAPGSALDLGDEDWLGATREQVLPFLRAIRRCAPGMRERRYGRIITIASVSVQTPIAGLDLSNFARAGLAAVHRTLARSLATDGVTVHVVMPGSILTDRSRDRIAARAAREGITYDEALAGSAARIPMGRLGAPEDVGNLVAFLAGPNSGYLTGTCIQVDGGMFTGLA